MNLINDLSCYVCIIHTFQKIADSLMMISIKNLCKISETLLSDLVFVRDWISTNMESIGQLCMH